MHAPSMVHTCPVTHPTSVLRPGVRTFKPRRSRITPRQRRALTTAGPPLLTEEGVEQAWDVGRSVVLDIGFGSADPVVQLAETFPDQVILAIDVYTPGVGDLVDRCRTESLENVFVLEADAVELLPRLPGRASGVRSFFPDPWPKARHHKRRLVQPAVVDAVHDALAPGGFWHIATDWAEYAESIVETFQEDTRWSGGPIARPQWRPVTHFERRALRDGREIFDMWFERT